MMFRLNTGYCRLKNYIYNFIILKTVLLVTIFYPPASALAAGEVYLVIGSDTAIWDGMNVRSYFCHYNIDLFTDPFANTYQVMDPAFRARFVDSYGQPLKMTWWMMAGNIFRYADNKNVPIPNIMTMYLMKKYHGNNVIANGDELSLHYHTFLWSDYDGDGLFWWNQSSGFLDCLEDFKHTLSQFLLEEQVFPVSFRSGWHYMDNDWQNYLDDYVLPYSMHNDHPNKNVDNTEPLDNNYDWSKTPAQFIPYQPSSENYQIPGDGPGWNVRSSSFFRTRYEDLLDSLFSGANNGENQIACLWGHLPESDFLTNIEIIDSLAHKMAGRYPGVKFRYCTAIEAMQRWRQSIDDQPPNLSLIEEPDGNYVSFRIQTDEPIFQTQPFVAVKDIYERYVVAPCVSIGINEWRTTNLFLKDNLVKAAVAVCDTFGNQAMDFIVYLPEDIYIDNSDNGYVEISGNWSSVTPGAWGMDSRMAQLSQSDSVVVQWSCDISYTAQYNIFIQIPEIPNPAGNILFKISKNQQQVDSTKFLSPLPGMDWVFLSTIYLQQTDQITVEMSVQGSDQPGKSLGADVIKLSALVKDKDIHLNEDLIDFGAVSYEDTASYELKIFNYGIENLQIFNVSSNYQTVFSDINFPVSVPGMSKIDLPLFFFSDKIGPVIDTLLILSDDPVMPEYKLPIYADVQDYFEIIDNEDSLLYSEYGIWFYSNAYAFGSSSRYAYLNAQPGASASYITNLRKNGIYQIYSIGPKTVNASNNALYEISIADIVVDSLYIDQNQGSGSWVPLGSFFIPAGIDIEIRIIDTGKSSAGVVLRADAIKFALINEITDVTDSDPDILPTGFLLYQNYPNPFSAGGRFAINGSPVTNITFQIPKSTFVKIDLFNLLGEKINSLVNTNLISGYHSVIWDAKDFNGNQVGSGFYYYQIQADKFKQTKKMLLLR